MSASVTLRDPERASGLADMLHQLLAQTLEDPARARRAARLRGEVAFRAAEDPSVCVRMRFGDRGVEVWDAEAGELGTCPLVTADFVSVAHMTTGRQSPLRLLAGGRLQARVRPRDWAFLAGVLSVLRAGHANARTAWTWRAAATAGAAGAAAGLAWWLSGC